MSLIRSRVPRVTACLASTATALVLAQAAVAVPPISAADELPAPVRVADVIDGHVHPSLCVAKNGDVLAVYNQQGGGGKELLLCRSTDGGVRWSDPSAVPGIVDCSIYPGSLTTLSDGRILLNWSCYRGSGDGAYRTPQFCLSSDHGRAWSPPRELPLDKLTNYSCLRHAILELSPREWVFPLYDRTVVYDPETARVAPFGDGRNHGMVPIVRTPRGTLVSGAPVANSGVQVVLPREVVNGLRSTDGGRTWRPIHAFPYFGVAGYDLTVLENGWIVFTSIVYGVGQDGEWAYELVVSRDDGLTWDSASAVGVYNPGRRIAGRGWPRTAQLDEKTLGTLFYDLDASQHGGPGLFFVRTAISKLAATAHPLRAEPPAGTIDTSLPIRVNNPRTLGNWTLPAERISLGEAYKPSMAMLPTGELVMVGLIQDLLPGGKVREWTPLWRSTDGGRTWSERVEIADMIGREQWLTSTRDGTLLATCHLLAQDVNNPDGYTHSYLHRSTDGGRNWERTRITSDGFPSPPEKGTMTSRNAVELADGTLLLGVGVNEYDGGRLAYLWKSRDGGKSWDKSDPPVELGGYQGREYHNWDSFFTEDYTFAARSGKLLHFIRCGPPARMYPIDDGRAVPTTDDSGDRTMRCESTDGGRTWSDVRDHGDYGMMYPRVIRLADGRLLLTLTQRSSFYPLGLQAILSHDDGETWNFDSDRIIIEGKTPWGMPSGGGFGNTLQLGDGGLVSCYSYRAADNKTYVEVVRWTLPQGPEWPH